MSSSHWTRSENSAKLGLTGQKWTADNMCPILARSRRGVERGSKPVEFGESRAERGIKLLGKPSVALVNGFVAGSSERQQQSGNKRIVESLGAGFL
jgi:hypothetical protein